MCVLTVLVDRKISAAIGVLKLLGEWLPVSLSGEPSCNRRFAPTAG
jgi:hypothetical protein